jgi:hypothetical protein
MLRNDSRLQLSRARLSATPCGLSPGNAHSEPDRIGRPDPSQPAPSRKQEGIKAATLQRIPAPRLQCHPLGPPPHPDAREEGEGQSGSIDPAIESRRSCASPHDDQRLNPHPLRGKCPTEPRNFGTMRVGSLRGRWQRGRVPNPRRPFPGHAPHPHIDPSSAIARQPHHAASCRLGGRNLRRDHPRERTRVVITTQWLARLQWYPP